ncbi:MAG: non-ribosomal peptide synthetase [Burkholderiales bacterium]
MNLEKEPLEKEISYWKEELAGAPTRLELATDKPRAAVQSFRAGKESFALPREPLKQLKAIGRDEDATLFMTLVAIFMILLHRYTGEDDILVGTPIFEQTRREAASVFGRVINSVVLRSRFTEDLNFRSLLRQVRERVLGAYAHSAIPFQQLATALDQERNPSHAPLLQVMFVFNDANGVSPQVKVTENRPLEGGASELDLTLLVAESANGAEGLVEFNAELFEADTIRRLCGHYTTLLEAITRDPDRSVSTLPMLTNLEQTQILYEWNDTRTEFPERCVHELFEQQVPQHPDAIALVFAGQQLSYRELNQRANQVAHRLRKCGVASEVLVAVCLERSADMVIALLGIWKAGGAYVPLDPTYPKERLSYMLGDAAVKVVLTQSKHRHLFPAHADVICLDSDWLLIEQESTANLDVAVTASSLAYVMYTSGSTGQPKGVMVLQRGLANYLCWAVQAYSIREGDRVPVHTSISFDLTVTALYTPLLAGARVEILKEDVGGQNLVTALRQGKEHSLVKITPAHLALLTEQLGPENAAGRTRLFVIGGENLLAESLLLWRESAPATRLINEYGPTETVVGCCVHEVAADDPRSGSVPIGRPIANTQLYVLDRYRNAVPRGVVGELYIGGAGVARGYLNRPELTQEKFIADPFSKESGARLYKTGDLARYRPDGTLEYLGRVDDQVKLRGFRIELGEIEANLVDHPDVRQAAVHLWTVKQNDVHIVACCVPAKAGVLSPVSLRKHLRARLPEDMVPQHFLAVGEIPLTPNGKVDRRRLPTPVITESRVGRHEAPSDSVEATIAEIWTKLIRPARPVSRVDNFFELGGHSLMGMQALRQIEDRLGVRLEFRVLFQENLSDLAKRCRSEDRLAK